MNAQASSNFTYASETFARRNRGTPAKLVTFAFTTN
jgi:hypothetical protein